ATCQPAPDDVRCGSLLGVGGGAKQCGQRRPRPSLDGRQVLQ
ncbi:unnamed protein product, partial [Ectocarpus sp. 4 AP-2014]